MHTLIVCRTFGFTVHHSDFGGCQQAFNLACNDPRTTCAAWYDANGNQVNAYHDPAQFRVKHETQRTRN